MSTDQAIGGNSDASLYGTEVADADQGVAGGDQSAAQAPAAVADAASQGATPASGQQPAAAVPTWDGTQFTLKYRGQQIVPPSKDQLVKWAQYGYDANERNRQLTAKEQELANRAKAYEEYERLDKMLKERPEIQEAIKNVIAQYQNGNAQGAATSAQQVPDELKPYVAGLINEINGLKQQVSEFGGWRQKADERQADAEIEAEVEALKKAHDKDDWAAKDDDGVDLARQIMKHAYDHGFPTLEAAYRDFMWDTATTAAKAEALKEAEAARLRSTKAGIVGKAGVGAPAPAKPAPYNPRGKSWQQVGKDALNEALSQSIST